MAASKTSLKWWDDMFIFIASTIFVLLGGLAIRNTYKAINVAIDKANYFSGAEFQESKKRLIPDKSHIIGLQSPRLVVKPTTLTTTKFDTTTYPDRAIITLTNSTGADIVCTGISIQGKVVYQFDGAFQWDYKDYNSIEKMGEKPIEISNRFIFSAEQTESLGDYITKELAPHSMYTLHIPGCLFCYDVGDVWHLAISYTINGQASEAELIDTDVEVTSVSFSRSVGGIGETLLQVRVPSGAWTKTTSRRARLISAGMPQNLYNRGNVITVAASDWTGQADYFCDGTDDDIEIQAAIDKANFDGGATVQLTNGIFNIDSWIEMKANVRFVGSGLGTIIKRQNIDYNWIIKAIDVIDGYIGFMVLDGNSQNITYNEASVSATSGAGGLYNVSGYGIKIDNVVVQNIKVDANSANYRICIGMYSAANVVNSTVKNLYCKNTGSGDAVTYGIEYGAMMSGIVIDNLEAVKTGATKAIAAGMVLVGSINSCNVLTMKASGGSVNQKIGYVGDYNMTNCVSTNAEANAMGYLDCKSVQQCKSVSNATPYTTSYADAASTPANACADTAAGGFNS